METFSVSPLAYAPDIIGGNLRGVGSRLPTAGILLPGAAARLLNRPILNDAGVLLGLMTIEENRQLLVGRWVGHCTPDAVVTGMRTALDMLTLYPCRAVLSDGSGATGDWSDLVPWMQYDMLPRLVEAGVRFIANVRSPDPAGRLAHQDYARFASQYLRIRLFDEPRSAHDWLRQELSGAQSAAPAR